MTSYEMSLTSPNDKPALRRELKRRRRALSAEQQRQAALALCQRLKQLPEIRRAKRISLYLPVNSEIDPTPLIPWLRKRRVAIYLPVLRPFSANSLWFVAYDANTPHDPQSLRYCRTLSAICRSAPPSTARLGTGHAHRAASGFRSSGESNGHGRWILRPQLVVHASSRASPCADWRGSCLSASSIAAR